MAIQLPGFTMKNPLMPASGTFGFGEGYAKEYDLNLLGALVTKSTTLAPRIGNQGTIFADGPDSTLNAVGLKIPVLMSCCTKSCRGWPRSILTCRLSLVLLGWMLPNTQQWRKN